MKAWAIKSKVTGKLMYFADHRGFWSIRLFENKAVANQFVKPLTVPKVVEVEIIIKRGKK